MNGCWGTQKIPFLASCSSKSLTLPTRGMVKKLAPLRTTQNATSKFTQRIPRPVASSDAVSFPGRLSGRVSHSACAVVGLVLHVGSSINQRLIHHTHIPGTTLDAVLLCDETNHLSHYAVKVDVAACPGSCSADPQMHEIVETEMPRRINVVCYHSAVSRPCSAKPMLSR